MDTYAATDMALHDRIQNMLQDSSPNSQYDQVATTPPRQLQKDQSWSKKQSWLKHAAVIVMVAAICMLVYKFTSHSSNDQSNAMRAALDEPDEDDDEFDEDDDEDDEGDTDVDDESPHEPDDPMFQPLRIV